MRDGGLKAAIKAAGGVRQLADLLKLNRQAVYQWERVPLERILQVEKVTGVARDILRPELYKAWPQKNSSAI
jgi:DNA-binding transcriptional regulator YdaS (Cro superfamily)